MVFDLEMLCWLVLFGVIEVLLCGMMVIVDYYESLHVIEGSFDVLVDVCV